MNGTGNIKVSSAETVPQGSVKGLELCRYVESRGFKANPLMNTQAATEGDPLRIMGYQLTGPRGNRTTIVQDRDGSYRFDGIKLWCDCVDYATSKIMKRKAR
jgi:hypothetical protein